MRRPRLHVLTEIDAKGRRGYCEHCGPTPIRRQGTGWRCSTKDKDRGRHRRTNDAYRGFKGVECERCKFQPEHQCQLDVHHIDGNHANNDPVNLMTLCANCHRLATWTLAGV
jgi:hypothetical protein